MLVSAVAEATDTVLIGTLTTGAPAAAATPAALLAAISNGAPRKPAVIGGLDAVLALPAGTIADLQQLGVAVLTTPAATGLLIAVDAAGLLISDGGLNVAIAREASLVLDDGGSPTSTTLVSLWQGNLAAVRAERRLRFAVRSGAVAWASTAEGSPA